jgi:hypothetical protein
LFSLLLCSRLKIVFAALFLWQRHPQVTVTSSGAGLQKAFDLMDNKVGQIPHHV